jgi:5-methylcytosine-specific restriction protein A
MRIVTRRSWDHGGKSRHERGYGTAWEKLRKVILQRDRHLCQLCMQEGRITAGTHVDHITAKAKGGTDDPANLQTVCAPCHALKSIHDQGKNPRLRKRRTIGLSGWPIEEDEA